MFTWNKHKKVTWNKHKKSHETNTENQSHETNCKSVTCKQMLQFCKRQSHYCKKTLLFSNMQAKAAIKKSPNMNKESNSMKCKHTLKFTTSQLHLSKHCKPITCNRQYKSVIHEQTLHTGCMYQTLKVSNK